MERIEIQHPAAMPHLEVWRLYESTALYKHFHSTYTICSLNSLPRGEWKYRGKDLSSASHDVMLMEPGEVHVVKRIAGASSCDIAFIEPSYLYRVAREAGYKGMPRLKTFNMSPIVYHLFRAFHHAMKHGGSELEVGARLLKGLSFLMRHCMEKPCPESGKAGASSAVQRARDFLYEHYEDRITLDSLAAMAGMGSFHFLRAFSRQFGLPPHSYQLRVRVARARELLLKRIPLNSVDLGFSDQSHLIRHFKQAVGVTPGQYAQMVRRPFSGAAA
jgi:AraC-like DNA-binding protein